ncbi:MAG: pilin [Patescibacteria group bacterium]|nr:pilin [Patescibacteria group bacterium]MDD5294739.1 pilin [Patescibacteria group bacterium]MDD5554569.1 pilin [Patescibacteria group bacterium]
MKKLLVLSLITFCFLFLFSFSVLAENGFGDDADKKGGTGVESKPVTLDNPLGKTAAGKDISPQELIGRIISAVLGIVGSLALAMFIYGGFTIMTAAGTAEKVEKGKQILIWAAIGLIIIFTSYALVNFVLTNVIKQAG